MIQLEKTRDRREVPLNVKLSKKEKKAMEQNAKRFANGNLSLWLRYAGVNYVPRRSDSL